MMADASAVVYPIASNSSRTNAPKRALEDEHAPSTSSPLNPDTASSSKSKAKSISVLPHDPPLMPREPRAKKESLKKREAKAGDAVSSASKTANSDRSSSSAIPTSNKKQATSNLVSTSLPLLSPLRYKLPPPKPLDYDLPKPPILTRHHVQDCNGIDVQFYEASEHVYNRKGFRYSPCIADPLFPSTFHYRQSDTPPFCPRINYEDSSSHILFSSTASQITTRKGFRMGRANVGVREGTWYWECRVSSGIPPVASPNQEPNGHVRIGFARREAPLDAPVGFDAYSYGLRDVAGQKVHMSRPTDFFPPDQDLREGDVIGLLISLPPLSLHQKIVSGEYNPAVDAPSMLSTSDPPAPAPNIVRDRVPIHYRSHLYFETYEYYSTKDLEELTHPSPHPPNVPASTVLSRPPNPTHPSVHLRTLPSSYIKVYLNGKSMGVPFKNLLSFLPPASKPQQTGAPAAREGLDDGLLGYFPAIAVFRGGAAEANFGPDWWCPPEEDDFVGKREIDGDVMMSDQPERKQPRPMAARYEEQIAEDVVWDVIDEVDFWLHDGAGRVALSGATNSFAQSRPGDAASSDRITKVKTVVSSVVSSVPLSVATAAVTNGVGGTTVIAQIDGISELEGGLITNDTRDTIMEDAPAFSIDMTLSHGPETEEIKELVQEDD